MCKAFNDFNYLLKIGTDLFTFDIQRIKTYEGYELNNNMTGDLEEPWLDNGVPYQLCDHICEPYRFKNGKSKWPICSSDIDGFCNEGELPGMVRVGCITYFQDHKWYDELVDGKLKLEALMHKAKVEGSWGDATPEVMKFCAWLKSSFENFHELDHDVLVKLEECWIYRADNAGNTQDNHEHKKEHHDPSTYHVRRFEMIKYSFDADDEYVAIKEHECSDHSKTNIDTCQAYQELFHIMDEGWLMTKATMYHDLYLSGKALVERENVGNHPEDDFMPLETIQRPYSVIRKRILFELEGKTFKPERRDSIATQTCEISNEEFNDFLTLYPIPSEYRVILPKSNLIVFDAPSGYVMLYTHSFSLSNLRLPLTEFFCEVLEYF
ncbi:hypothetical protein Tco_1264508 [Tanacetum coccineum]